METHFPNSSGIWHGKYMPILCQEFWTCPNPCVKDFRILDLPEPLRQRFQNFGPTQTLASKISEFWTYPNPCVKDFRILDLLELFAIAESETLSMGKWHGQHGMDILGMRTEQNNDDVHKDH